MTLCVRDDSSKRRRLRTSLSETAAPQSSWTVLSAVQAAVDEDKAKGKDEHKGKGKGKGKMGKSEKVHDDLVAEVGVSFFDAWAGRSTDDIDNYLETLHQEPRYADFQE